MVELIIIFVFQSFISESATEYVQKLSFNYWIGGWVSGVLSELHLFKFCNFLSVNFINQSLRVNIWCNWRAKLVTLEISKRENDNFSAPFLD